MLRSGVVLDRFSPTFLIHNIPIASAMKGQLHKSLAVIGCCLSIGLDLAAQSSRPLANPGESNVPSKAVLVGELLPPMAPAGALLSTDGVESMSARQGREEIETDRDSFTPATTTAGRGRLILESAYTFLDNRGVKETHSFPEVILRYGVTEHFELRLGWNYEVGGVGNDVSGSGFSEDELFDVPGLERESRVSYGAKVSITRPDGWVPRSALLLTGYTPTSGKPNDTHLAVTYVFGWELPERLRFDAALRYGTASEEEDRFNIWAPSAVLRVPVGEKWAVHAEYFGLYSAGKERDFTRHYFSPGVHYLVTEDLEIGVRVGWGLNDQASRFFANAGIGWRF